MKSLIVIILSFIFLLACEERNPPIVESFSKKDWKVKDRELPYNHRVLFIGDLKKNYLFEGMTKSKIIELLGEPEQSTKRLIGYKIYEEVENPESKWHSSTFHTHWLKILLDENGINAIDIYFNESYYKI